MTTLAEKLDACPSCQGEKPWSYDAQTCTACGYGLLPEEHPETTAVLATFAPQEAYAWRAAFRHATNARIARFPGVIDDTVYGDPYAEHRTHGGRL